MGAHTIPERDQSGRQISKMAIATKGATYSSFGIEFTTSTLSSQVCKKISFDGSNIPFLDDDLSHIVSFKLYDASKNEITLQANEGNAVLTAIEFELQNESIELIAGRLLQSTKPTTNMRLFVTAVPDVPYAYGGQKQMVRGINLKLLDQNALDSNGRASKYLTFDATNHTSKLGIYLAHDAGVKHELNVIMDMYRS